MAIRVASRTFHSLPLPVLYLFALLLAAIPVSVDARASAPASYPIATAVRLGGSETDTRFVMDLTHTIPFRAFVLTDPYRVVVDIPEVIFRLPPNAGEDGRGLIREFRFGLMAEGESRIVLDVRKPVSVAKACVLAPAAGDPARLVLELIPADRDSFLRQVARDDALTEKLARAAGAALFVSLHANYLPPREGEAHGLTVFTLSKKASSSEAAREADEENSSDTIAGIDLKSEPSDVAQILFDLAQRETKIDSVQFARTLVGDLRGTVQLHDPAIESANFVVLRDFDVPSVLVELGYVSDRGNLASLTSPTWRDRAADAVAKAIEAFLISMSLPQRQTETEALHKEKRCNSCGRILDPAMGTERLPTDPCLDVP
jgi:hypothetical protein